MKMLITLVLSCGFLFEGFIACEVTTGIIPSIIAIYAASGPTFSYALSDNCLKGPVYWCANYNNQKECKAVAYCTKEHDDHYGQDPCTWGPSYWCHNITTMEQCHAFEYCSAPGRDPCSRGPIYWCYNATTIKQCRAEEYCYSTLKDRCEEGPSYWCQSLFNAINCGLHALERCIIVGKSAADESHPEPDKSKSSVVVYGPVVGLGPILGKDNCTWGPGFWCEDYKNAFLCGALDYCGFKLKSPITKPIVTFDTHLPGRDRCTWGPSYWCANYLNAFFCTAVEYCNTHVWHHVQATDQLQGGSIPQPKAVDYNKVGNDPCTWGPSYWCADVRNAFVCGGFETFKYCYRNNGFHSSPAGPPGSDKCANGPAVWCSDILYAIQCGEEAVNYCFDNIWYLPHHECTQGQTFWCKNPMNSLGCGFPDFQFCYYHGGNLQINEITPCGSLAPWDLCNEPLKALECGSKAVQYCLDNNLWSNNITMLQQSVDDCKQGPVYWCQNSENAERCHATSYCYGHGPVGSKY